MTTATVFSSDGTAYSGINNIALDSGGVQYTVNDYAYDSGGSAYQVFGSIVGSLPKPDGILVAGINREINVPFISRTSRVTS